MNDVRCIQKALWCCTAALSLFLVSCSASSEFYRDVDANVAQGKHEIAIETVRKNRSAYGDKSTVLYNLDMGVLFHYAAQPDSSTKYLLAAEREIEDLYTKSISQAALSFLLNDNVLPYDGEDFEKVLVNIFLALNFAEKGLPDEALVEARKVDLKLREYAKKYEGKNTYQEDAFIRYVAGVLYESGGEINDAFISYRKSYEAYQTYAREYATPAPEFLLDDLVRTATLLSFGEEAEQYRSLGGGRYDKKKNFEGSILVLVYAGRGPIKEEIRPTVSIPDSSGTLHTFQVALPKFVSRFKASRPYTVSTVEQVEGAHPVTSSSVLAENITQIAGKTLDDRMALTYLKSGGRALLKFLAAEKAKKEINKDNDSKLKNFLGSLAVDLFVGATEQADTRTWRTLPAEIQLSRLSVPPGTYDVTVVSSDGGFTQHHSSTHVQSGRTSIVIVDDVR